MFTTDPYRLPVRNWTFASAPGQWSDGLLVGQAPAGCFPDKPPYGRNRSHGPGSGREVPMSGSASTLLDPGNRVNWPIVLLRPVNSKWNHDFRAHVVRHYGLRG